jgi:hypothetical protein
MVTAVSFASISAGQIIPFIFYPYLLCLSAIAFMVIPALFKKKTEKTN